MTKLGEYRWLVQQALDNRRRELPASSCSEEDGDVLSRLLSTAEEYLSKGQTQKGADAVLTAYRKASAMWSAALQKWY
jgi:hypothetical protein